MKKTLHCFFYFSLFFLNQNTFRLVPNPTEKNMCFQRNEFLFQYKKVAHQLTFPHFLASSVINRVYFVTFENDKKCSEILIEKYICDTLRKLYFQFLSHWMGYDRGGNFTFDFTPNGIPFGSENRKENCNHDHIPFNLKGYGSIVYSVYTSRSGWHDPEIHVWQEIHVSFIYT